MNTRKVCFVLMAIATILCPTSSAQKPRDGPVFVIMENRDAPGTVELEKLDECLRVTLREMNLDSSDLPRIVVYHVSHKTADYLSLETNSIWKANIGGYPRYEMWIVGKPSNFLYSYMVVSILQKHFHVTIDEMQRSRIVSKVEQSLNATVDVRSSR